MSWTVTERTVEACTAGGREPGPFGQLYVSAMTSAVVTRKRAISIGWVVVFAFLLGLTIWLASSANGSSGAVTSPSPTGTFGSPVVSSPPAAQASGPDTWVVISALGTAAAGIGALVSSAAAVSAVRVAARQSQTAAATAAPVPVVRKRKKRR